MQNPDDPEHVIPYHFSPDEDDYWRLKGEAFERVLRAVVRRIYQHYTDEHSGKGPSDWMKKTIGPVRSIYYREIIIEYAPQLYPAMSPPPPEGEWLQYVLETQKIHTWFWKPRFDMMHGSDFISQGSARNCWDWLVGDLYLEELLNSLGVQWAVLENAMLKAFWDSLPAAYKQAYSDMNSNTPRAWQRAWTEYVWLEQHRKSLSAVEALYEAETNASQRLLDDKMLYGLKNFVARKDRAEKITTWACDLDPKFPRFSTLTKSPFVTPVVMAVAETLWPLINPQLDALNPVKIISKKKQSAIEQGNPTHKNYIPIQFWHLISDVLLHVPILVGLPDEKRFTSEYVQEISGQSVKKRYFMTNRELR